jgi:hypothetical protein
MSVRSASLDHRCVRARPWRQKEPSSQNEKREEWNAEFPNDAPKGGANAETSVEKQASNRYSKDDEYDRSKDVGATLWPSRGPLHATPNVEGDRQHDDQMDGDEQHRCADQRKTGCARDTWGIKAECFPTSRFTVSDSKGSLRQSYRDRRGEHDG